MNRTILLILATFLTSVSAVALNCVLWGPTSSQFVPATSAQHPSATERKTVSHGGVSFVFDPSLASEVRFEAIPAMTDGKPSDIVPDHPAFFLVGYPLPRSLPAGDPQLRVFKLVKFRKAVAIASAANAKSVISPKNLPSWTTYFDEEVRTLKVLLATRPTRANLRSVIAKARHHRDNTRLPFLPMWDATQAFVAHIRYVHFRNGKGVFFLTQWDPSDTSQVTNAGLEYAFQGITNDGQYYVYAEFAVKAPFLPNGDEPDVVAWEEKNYLLPHESREYQTYLRPVLEKLESLPASDFQPNLELLEQLIQSLKVDRK